MIQALIETIRKKTIAARLLFYILMTSFFFTLIGTSFQLYIDFLSDKSSVESQIDQIENIYLKSLAKSTWDLDRQGIILQLEGVLKLQDIKYLEIKTELGETLASSGNASRGMDISKKFTLNYNHLGEVVTVGSLQVVASLEGVYGRLWKRLLVILSTQSIKIFCMSAFIIIIFQRLITRHLRTMANYAEKVDLDHLENPLVLKRKHTRGSYKDELDMVVNSFNEMRENLIADINKRIQAEESLRKSEEQHRLLIEQMNDGLLRIDTKGNIIYGNPKIYELLEYDQEELVGLNLIELLDDENRVVFANQFRHREKGDQSTYEIEFLTKSNRKIPVIVSPKPLFDDCGSFIGSQAILMDISKRKHMEKLMIQAEKMISVGSLAAGMAHEINNPLGAILQGAQNIERRVSPDFPKNLPVAEECNLEIENLYRYLEKRKVLTYLKDIKEAGSRAAGIIKNMLLFSRSSASVKMECHIPDILDQSLDLAKSDYDLKKEYDFKQIQIQKEYADEKITVLGVETELEQVFLNLLRNSAQAIASLKGLATPKIILRACVEQNMIRIELEDNGFGMDEEIRKRIFDPFFTTKPVGKGTGLGLFVSYMIITNNHAGSMTVDSGPDWGTRFVIHLPSSENL